MGRTAFYRGLGKTQNPSSLLLLSAAAATHKATSASSGRFQPAMAEGCREGRNPATFLTDDLIVEILSRLPVKSICRFKCVSKHWRGLISHRHHRKKLPQTLAGFFYNTTSRERFPESARHFTNVTGMGAPLIRPSLSFLPDFADIAVLDCCNGLLLCRSTTVATPVFYRYIVSNPATEEWVALPESSQAGIICEALLGFDPAVSPNFHVFEFSESVETPVESWVEIYSSETGQWVRRDSGWSDDASLWDCMSTVFLNGFLHVLASEHQDVLAVDTKGNSWRTIPAPQGNDDGFIGHSQGHLYYLNTIEEHDWKLSVYVLEDYASDEWIFKHSVDTSDLLGINSFDLQQHYTLISIHPECHLIFFVSDLDHTIRCYNMDSREVHVIRHMGCELDCSLRCCLSYVPLFSEALAAWN